MNSDATKPEVLVIDDEPQIRSLLRFTLEDAGYVVREAATGHAGLIEIAQRHYDVVILDLGLPDMPGLQVLKRLREWKAVRVLILSVFDEESTKIAGLDAGADDYLTKPFGGGELLARLRAMLRRTSPTLASSIVRFGPIEVDVAHRRVTKSGQPVKLTPMEYALLTLFITHPDKVLTHRYVLRELWGPRFEMQTQNVRTYMLRLRRKLGEDVELQQYFQTESGVGYRFVGELKEVASAAHH